MSKSLFAKLTSSQPKPIKSSGDSSETGSVSWTATLNRQDNTHLCLSSAHVVVSSPPLNSLKIEKGCICRVLIGPNSEPFLISVDSASVTSGIPAKSIAICPRLLESLVVGKDVKSVTIEEISDGESIAQNTLTDLVIGIKDRYVSKRDLWAFQIRLLGSVVYRSLSPPFSEMLNCSSVTVEDLSCGSKKSIISGIVGPQTRVVIRSFSSQLVIVISITSDLWEIDSQTREIKFMKMVSAVCDGLEKAKTDDRNHHLLLIGTCRPTVLANNDMDGCRDIYEVFFEGQIDRFSVVDFRSKLVSFFNNWPFAIGWIDCPIAIHKNSRDDGVVDFPNWFTPPLTDSRANFVRDNTVCGCRVRNGDFKLSSSMIPSHSSDSNILESINLALNHFGKHHMDRRLKVTGTQITLISACNGIFRVSNKSIVDITRKRVESTSCSIRVISVGDKPVCLRSPVIVIFEHEQLSLPWLWFSFYTSNFAAPNGLNRMEKTIDEFARRVEKKSMGDDIFVRSSAALKPPPNLGSSLASSRTCRVSAEKILRKQIHPREKRTDDEILDLGIVTPRLQRVAIEVSVKASDVKPIDNWTVPGEGLKTFHDLIGTRLALDMQLIDASGAWDTSSGVEPSREKLSTSFGVLVSRASMRDTHIQKVMIKGEGKCVWVLNRLESGNIYVSRVNLIGDSMIVREDGDAAGRTTEQVPDHLYEYVLVSRGLLSTRSPISDVIVCKSCLEISHSVSFEKRKFFIPQPLPWNLLDDVIANPYMQQSLPSTVPNNQSIPQELVGTRWKFRSAIRTQLFALVPKEDEFCHLFSSNVASLGSCDSLTSPLAPSPVTSRLLDWTTRVGNLIGTPLPVSVVGKKNTTTGFIPTIVRQRGSDWFIIHIDPNFVFPKLFVVSIEWILCQSSVIESVIDSMKKFAIEDGFDFVQLPHSQLFPQPAPSSSIHFDELPFHQKISLLLPNSVNPMCYHFLVSRMVDQLGLLVVFASREFTHPEGFAGQTMVFSRQPGWILMDKSGSFYVAISSREVEWIPSRFSEVEKSHDMTSSFLKWKQIIHTSIVDSTSKT